ncbi:hypothetical protein ABZW30_43860 [Kitasatospora sp. NPDC004669]|uniref:hypothetical protein n=1 Tax=Kitasatospora sp. NPDC004669 TaxID=3154555 RepID=UPI0033B47B3A
MSTQVELVDETGTINQSELTKVAAALQKQAQHDLASAWGVAAQVTAGTGNGQPGVWPIFIREKSPAGLGVHLDDKTGQPFAVIEPGTDWSVTASHELLEMLVDPLGSRMVTGPSIDPAANGRPVHYLVEVGDPVETREYEIDGVKVSDFVLPAFYQRQAPPNGGYDERQQLNQPLEILPGGYISWWDPADNRWHQKTPDGTFVTAKAEADLSTSFRDSRDKAFPDDPDRHDLRKIRKMR